MATIKEIASMAGVSRGTVDRVLHNRGIVNPETAAKIRSIAESMQYAPNRVGRVLAIKKRNLKLGYIMFSSTSSNPFFEDVVRGIRQKAKELAEYSVTVEMRFSEFDSHSRQLELIDELVAIGINGLAITPVNHPDIAARLQKLSDSGIPVITVNSDIENSGRLAYVGSNYSQGGQTAGGLMRLFTGGKAKIGVLHGSQSVLCHSERIAGFKSAISQEPEMQIVDTHTNGDDDIESFSVTKKMLREHPEIDAIYLVSAGVYGACRAVLDVRPENLPKIICFDTTPAIQKLIRSGVINAAIGQQPHKQGSRPLDLLFNYLATGAKPDKEFYYTSSEIKILENL